MHFAGVPEDRIAVFLLKIIDIRERARRVFQQFAQRLLAVHQPDAAQIIAVQIKKVEGEELKPR